MKKALIAVLAVSLLSLSLWAAGPKTYQVTGPILEIKGDVIVVQKGNDKWEVAKDAATKITGELKVGAKVTIEYTMTAKAIEVKGEVTKAAPKTETKATAKSSGGIKG